MKMVYWLRRKGPKNRKQKDGRGHSGTICRGGRRRKLAKNHQPCALHASVVAKFVPRPARWCCYLGSLRPGPQCVAVHGIPDARCWSLLYLLFGLQQRTSVIREVVGSRMISFQSKFVWVSITFTEAFPYFCADLRKQ